MVGERMECVGRRGWSGFPYEVGMGGGIGPAENLSGNGDFSEISCPPGGEPGSLWISIQTKSPKQMTKFKTTSVCAAIAMFSAVSVSHGAGDDAIKEAMKGGFKGDTSLAKLASEGKASKEDIAKLKAYVESLVKAKPPVGDDASWKTKTEALLKSVVDLESGAADAPKAFEKAANCKACHEVHKPKKK